MKRSDPLSQAVEAAALSVKGRLFVAVSGGIDSMVLLSQLLEAKARLGSAAFPELRVLHVNHALRGAESDGDEALVLEAARAAQVPFLAERLSWENESPSQAACRRMRREFFRRAADQPGDCVFLAHHQDDQAETLLLKLIRGVGLEGLRGMLPHDGFYVRPMLAFSRAEVVQRAQGLKWREDSSNAAAKYDRNWLRLEILPKIESRRPGVSRRLAALAEEAAGRAKEERKISLFDSNQGFTLAPLAALAQLNTGGLSRFYGLSRLHAEHLAGLLKKGSGRVEAEGVRFHLSQGYLLAEREGRLEAEVKWSEREATSLLGAWQFENSVMPAASGGEKAKKEFQRAGVPLFLRAAYPRLEGKGFVPAAEGVGYSFQPSPLANWLHANSS